jgi:ATP adenylyltransferase
LQRNVLAALPECVFCTEVAGGDAIVLRHGSAVARPDQFPVTPGHTLVIPKRHVEQLFDLSDSEMADVWQLLNRLREVLLTRDEEILGFNVGINVGEVAGQTVPHVHVHLIPRRLGDTADPRGGVRGVIPDRMRYDPAHR